MPSAMIGRLRAVLVLAGVGALTLALLPPQLLAMAFRLPLRRTLPRLWHRSAAALIGLRIAVRGAPASGRPLLLVSNHQSWADMVALGAVVECAFIAKSEVRAWPLVGWLARLQRTVFVERARRTGTDRQADEIARRLEEGDAMVLFAEGTTSDGNGVLPFKTALFGALQTAIGRSGEDSVLVQPVAIAWTKAHGLPLGRAGRPLAAWSGDEELAPHLMAFLREGAFDVEIVFAEPLPVRAGSDRKAVAGRCRDLVAQALAETLHPARSDAPETDL